MQLAEAFSHTGWVGKAVLAVLFLFSLFSWATMIVAGLRFQKAAAGSRRFLTLFRKAKRLVDVQAATAQSVHSPLVALFKAGYAEIDAQMVQAAANPGAHRLKSLPAVERALQRAVRVESARLSHALPFLATTASATPFIGLFGTIWGIMNSFSAIGTSGSASIVVVAPGISEALINTAAGLFAAIPALIAYNYFLGRLRRTRQEMEDFMLEFLNLTERNFT